MTAAVDEVLSKLGDQIEGIFIEAMKASVEAAKKEGIEEGRTLEQDEHECDHTECKTQDAVDQAGKDAEDAALVVEADAELAWSLLEQLGVDKRELMIVAGHLHPLDVLRHVERMPSFRARIIAIADRALTSMENEAREGTRQRARNMEVD